MNSRRPYMLRAMHEWITDNNCTPQIVVDANVEGVQVPRQFVSEGKIVLNISWSATSDLKMGNDELRFNARFGGTGMVVRVPSEAVLAVYARETGQGMLFTDEEETPPPSGGEDGSSDSSGARTGRPQLKVVK